MSGVRIPDFDTWSPRYGNATIEVHKPGDPTDLLPIFTDFALTIEADNPQVLAADEFDGVSYGKWNQPIYVGQSYQLRINSVDESGIVGLPITDLTALDGSYLVASTARSNVLRRLIDRFDAVVFAEDYGEIGSVSATNTATLNAAIGAVAGQGGGAVVCPAGDIEITTLELSGDVVLVGQHKNATTLQSQVGDDVITLSGDGAGLSDLTLDGISLIPGSTGVKAVAQDKTCFENVLVKRFVTGFDFKGGQKALWRNLSIDNCTTGAKLSGDEDAGDSAAGTEYQFNAWNGGEVMNCTSRGVWLNFEDKLCRHNTFRDVGFVDNAAGIGLDINGARYTRLEGNCYFSGNLTNINWNDDSDSSYELLNTVIGLFMEGGYFSGGAIKAADTSLDVVFEGVSFSDVDWTLTQPLNHVLLRDCLEDALVTYAGDTLFVIRWKSIEEGEISGVTTDATATVAWEYTLPPGKIALVEAKVIGNQQDGEEFAIYHIEAGVRRPGSTLNYDAQTSNFTVGEVLTGTTSGATARIVADADAGASGTLTLRNIVGTFQNDETITDFVAGSATVNGVLTEQNAALDAIGVTETRAKHESDVNTACTIAVSVGNVQVKVTGIAAETWEWTALVKIFIA